MFKKYTAIFCIYISCVILHGHNIIPHSHPEAGKTTKHLHHKGIGHLFDHYLHASDSFITNKVNCKTEVTAINYNIIILLTGCNNNTDDLFNRLTFSWNESPLINISPFWKSSGLRAPPFIA